MNRTSKAFCRFSVAAIVAGAAFLWSGQLTLDPASLVSSAEARIGRPLTPMSYAGVARRTTRRAVVGGAAVAAGAAAAGAYYAAPVAACSQVVDAYGHVVTVCR